MPAKASFYYAQLAKQQRFENLSDAIQSSSFSDMDKQGSRQITSQIDAILNGPLRPVTWKETFSVDIQREIEKVNEEVAETVRKWREQGIPFTGRVEDVKNPLAPPTESRFAKAGKSTEDKE